MLALLLSLVAGAAPPAALTPEQVEALRGRDVLRATGLKAWQDGSRALALALLKAALATDTRVLGPWHRRTEAEAEALANGYQALGEWKEEAACRRVVAEARRVLDGEAHWRTKDARLAVAEAEAQAKRTPAQRAALRRALGLHAQAVAWHRDGQDAKALPLAKQASALAKESLGKEHPSYATTLNTLGLLTWATGDADAALDFHRRALALRKKALGEAHPRTASSMNNLALVLLRQRQHEEALALLAKSASVTRAALGEQHPVYATALDNLAAAQQAAGDLRAARRLVERALELRRQVLSEKHPDCAKSMTNLASLLRAERDPAGAARLLQQALKLTTEALGRSHPERAVALGNLAFLHLDKGEHRAALPFAEEALALSFAHLRACAAEQSDRQQLEAVADLRHRLDARLSIDDGPKHPPAAAHVLDWKGAIFTRQVQRRIFVRLAADSRTKAVAERLRIVTSRLAALRSSGSATKEGLEALREEQDEAQAALAKSSAFFRAERDKARPTPEALAAALPEGTILVDYLFYWRLGQRPGERLAAFVHRRGKPAVRVEFGPASAVEDAVREWRPLLVRGKDGLALGRKVKERIWTALEKHLVGAKVVLVSPDGLLGTVPFAALPGTKAGTYLIEDTAFAVVPVPSALPGLLEPVAEQLSPSLLVAGDLRYAASGKERFDALPATKAEVVAVREAFQKRHKDGKSITLLKGDATKAAVCKSLPTVRYAHFATHGWFAPESARSYLSEAGGKERREATGWHPLLLSGLALSDANRVPGPGEDDGILTALEVSEIDLTKLELATLSACETGLGKVAAGEGLLGLQRAFQMAGARSVVSSLWSVDDEATRQLMSDFYAQAWDAKAVSRAEALRRAQLAMLFGNTLEGKPRGAGKKPEKLPEGDGRERLPPYYWAAFVLSGDWR